MIERFVLWASAASAVLLLAGCGRKVERYTTKVQILQVQGIEADLETTPSASDLELKFVDCPGDARKIIRTDKAFRACAAKLKSGDRLEAEVIATYNSESGSYRSEIVRLGDCSVKTDPKDMANYDVVQVCTELVATGLPVGVHCDRRRTGEIIEKCPWFRRR